VSNLLRLIKDGEGKTLELKERLPENESIARTVLAFSNTSGGRLVVGVNDQRVIVGVDENDIFQIQDKIASIIFDSCYPNILPEIYTLNVEGKLILVVEIFRGNLLPYYLKKEGKNKGTYIRIGATNRLAAFSNVIDLERQKRQLCFDEEINYEYSLGDLNLDPLYKVFQGVGKDLDDLKLKNLKLIKEENNKLYPTNALLILLGTLPQCTLKCGRFKGTTMDLFIDKKEYSGNLFAILDSGLAFILNHINLRGEIKGLQRTDTYELPVVALREALINALIHRDYTNEGRDIKVGIYDDVVNIVSPGSFPNTITADDINEGRSEARNKAVARVFKELNLIEQWGSGIRRIKRSCFDLGLREPLIQEKNDFVDVEIWRPIAESQRGKVSENQAEATCSNGSLPQVNRPRPIATDSRRPIQTDSRRPKFFNTAGPVNQEEHYRLDPLHRWDLEEILMLIRQKKYFVFHAPRQTGKTSCMLALQDYLNASGEYNAIYLNVEIGQSARNNVERGIGAIVNKLSRCVNNENQRLRLMEIVNENKCDDALNAALEYISETSDKPVVLFIDEIDSLIGDTLISVLRQIRSSYDKRPDMFPASVILCGVRDIRDYRIQRSDAEIVTGGSAFNISVKSLTLDNFSRAEVERLLLKHTTETGQKFEQNVFDYIFQQTGGQPWLVNAVAYEVTCEMKKNRDCTVVITKTMAIEAMSRLIVSRAVHFDQLAHKLMEPRVKRIILPLLMGQNEHSASDDDIEYCIDLGLLKNSDKGIVVSNPMYSEIIPRELNRQKQISFKTIFDPDWINDDGSLNVALLFEMFQSFWRENSEIWSKNMSGYEEAAPHLVFQAFLQRVANGCGYVRREYALGRKRTDLYLEWQNPGKVQRVIVELKIMRKNDSYDSIKVKALEQTAEYSKRCLGTENHIVVFDRDQKTDWREKLFSETAEYDGMHFTIWGM
jgi:ATP-dependent DNA helicase RecG